MSIEEVDMHNIRQNVLNVSEERLDKDHIEDSNLEWEES